MFLALNLLLCSVSLIEGFRGFPQFTSITRRGTDIQMNAQDSFKRESKKIMVGILAVLSASTITLNPSPSLAANYGGFGSSYSEVLDPKTAVLNDELAKSDEVKAGLEGLNKALQTVADLKLSLVNNNDHNNKIYSNKLNYFNIHFLLCKG